MGFGKWGEPYSPPALERAVEEGMRVAAMHSPHTPNRPARKWHVEQRGLSHLCNKTQSAFLLDCSRRGR